MPVLAKKGGVGPRPLFLMTFNEKQRCLLNDCFVGIGVGSLVSLFLSSQDNIAFHSNRIVANIDIAFRN
jgi:hypothetical protein